MYQVSLFINTWSKTPTTITFEDFFAMVRNGHWKVPTEGHRSCLAKDRKHDAQTIKDSMACVIPAGICKNGHAKNNLTSLSLALCIDIDHTDEQTKDIFVRACLLEYVLGAFISISGRGVKLFIRIDIDGVNDYPAIYEATAKLVSTVLGVENDGKCKDITHPCFGSYDPDAYYNGDAKAVNDFLPNGALTPRVTYAPVTSAPRTTCTPTSFSNGHPPAMPDNRISAAPFVQSYLTLYPAATGDRNGTVFRLSCAACKRGIDRNELTTELVRTLEEDNFREPEIARTVKSAYQNVMTAAETESFENPPSNSSKVQKSVIGFSENENPAEKEDEIIGEELREQTPTFPDEIYDLIPAIFKECVSIARDERERDGLLLSCITTISSMLPSVSIRYNRRNYQPNIYCIVVASSGANKNLIGYGIRLHKHYCEYWEKQSLKIEKEYKKALRDYTLSLQAIRKKNTAATNLPDEPEEPKLAFPLIPADISRAQLITHLINNQSCSSLLTSTEASSVSTARNQRLRTLRRYPLQGIRARTDQFVLQDQRTTSAESGISLPVGFSHRYSIQPHFIHPDHGDRAVQPLSDQYFQTSGSMAGCVRGGKGAGGRSLQRVVHALRTDGIVSERFSYGSKADRYTEKRIQPGIHATAQRYGPVR